MERSTEYMIEVMKAFADGKEIQSTAVNGEWMDDKKPNWTWGYSDYRIKPEIKKDSVYIVSYCGKIEKVFNSYKRAKDYYYDSKMFCNPDDYTLEEFELN